LQYKAHTGNWPTLILKPNSKTNTNAEREEHSLRVFENRVLRRIFGPKRDEVTGEWRKLHNEELRDLNNQNN
jgi:hypothetical protein